MYDYAHTSASFSPVKKEKEILAALRPLLSKKFNLLEIV